MKKNLLILAVAAAALASCSSDEVVSQNTTLNEPQQKEISFSPLARPTTRAAVSGTVFPTNLGMQVAAYDVTNSREFFGATPFTYSGAGTIWTGGKYWPLSPTYITFLAYTNFQGTGGSETTGATWATPNASGVTLVMTDNSTNQKDLMCAFGNGEVTQSGNGLTFPTNVQMSFVHAQAWISFYADAYDAASGGKVTLNSITLNGASYAGTYTITHTNYNNRSAQDLSCAWSDLGPKGTDSSGDETSVVADLATPNTKTVPNWTPAAIAYDSGGNGVAVGDGLLIVPDDDNTTADFKSFTISYTLDGKTYEYTYTPPTPASANVQQRKHYTYNINFHLHEIQISADVINWDNQTPESVPLF